MIALAQGDGGHQCAVACGGSFAGQVSKRALLQYSTRARRGSYPFGSACACGCLEFLDGFDQCAGHGLAVAVEHAGVITKEQCIFHAGEALALSALDDDDIL